MRMKMANGKLNLISWTSALLIASICTSGIKAAETGRYGGILAPDIVSPLGCTTTGAADSGFYLVNVTIPYTFVILEQLSPVIAVARTVYIGQAGLEINLNIYNFIGALVQTRGVVYFFNFGGCPKIERVENSAKLIYGYRNLFGYLAYRAFQSLAVGCDFKCNACPISLVSEDPNLQEAAQGKSTVFVRNIQSYTLIYFGLNGKSLQSIRSSVDSTLNRNGVQDYNLTISGSCCINVNSQNPFLYSCPVSNKTITSQLVDDAINNKAFQQQNQFCSYAISQAAAFSKIPQPLFTRYRFVIPANDNAMIFISCYSVFELFSFIAEEFFAFC